MLGFLLFGSGAVVFTIIFVTESSCANQRKERHYYQSSSWLFGSCACIILNNLLFT